jgi:phosphorylcholine metabolism protein LicD
MNDPFSLRTEEMKTEIIKDMKTLELFFKEQLDLDTYLIYGTLLGAIREHDFIPHDTDIDIGYISNCGT